ncbi:MAG TPA: hypothetical protein PKO09_12215 [Anaerolineae bacterium]|nr:hypothetical protein [Anaerolineae bacterium]
MSRIWVLTGYLVRALFGSLAGVAPLAAAVTFGLIAFEYGMDQAQLFTVGGLGIGVIGFLATLLLAGKADRAASYLLVGRLRSRTELLAAIGAGGWCITWALALGIVSVNLLAGRLTLSWPSLLWLVPTWSVLWLLTSALAVALSGLVSRGASNLLGYLLLVVILVANDRQTELLERGASWAVRIAERVTWPVGALLAEASAGVHGRTYLLALALVLFLAAALFLLAAYLFRDKDVLWSE